MLWLYVFYRYYLVAEVNNMSSNLNNGVHVLHVPEAGESATAAGKPLCGTDTMSEGPQQLQARGTPRRDRSLNPLVSPSMDPLQYQYQLDIRAEDAVTFLRHRALSHLKNLTALQESCFFTSPSYSISYILCFCWTSRSSNVGSWPTSLCECDMGPCREQSWPPVSSPSVLQTYKRSLTLLSLVPWQMRMIGSTENRPWTLRNVELPLKEIATINTSEFQYF